MRTPEPPPSIAGAEDGDDGRPHLGDDGDALGLGLFHVGEVGRDERGQSSRDEQKATGTHVQHS